MQQALGRTARQGQKGSSRIICLTNQYINSIESFSKNDMNDVLSKFQIKNIIQIEYIHKFRNTRDWIFSSEIHSQKLSSEEISILKSARINANRIKAFNFEFPICISIQTTLSIQSQKIFSFFNCPKCKYTWMLFQKYIREMILESWSIFVDQTDKKYEKLDDKNVAYDQFLNLKFKSYMNY